MIQKFRDWFARKITPTRPAVPEQIVVRLEHSVFVSLKHKLGGAASTHANSQTTEIQAGFMLGVQHVLNVLQEGYVVESARPVR